VWYSFVPGDRTYGTRLSDQVAAGLADHRIPILDLEHPFFEHHSYEQLIVDPLDEHFNEIAHGIAAREIPEFLRREGLLRR
jgi:hypothetical protein